MDHRRQPAEDTRKIRRTQLAGSTRRARAVGQPEQLGARAGAALSFGHRITLAGPPVPVQVPLSA